MYTDVYNVYIISKPRFLIKLYRNIPKKYVKASLMF